MLEPISVGTELAQRGLSVLEVLLSAAVLPKIVTVEQWFQSSRIVSRFLATLLVGPGISGLLAGLLFHGVIRQHLPDGLK